MGPLECEFEDIKTDLSVELEPAPEFLLKNELKLSFHCTAIMHLGNLNKCKLIFDTARFALPLF